MAAVASGDVGPIAEELEREKGKGEVRERRRDSLSEPRGGEEALAELAAFAISTQGLSALAWGIRGASGLPAPLSDFLFSEISFARARASRLLETLAATVAALRAAGVEVVALKGAVLAFFHYPDPALRPMGDLDLLLRDRADLGRATAALVRAGWRPLFDTSRHRVFARGDERVARPASEDPDNPIRVEVHTSFRLPVLGRVYDASAALRAGCVTRDLGGTAVNVAAGPALPAHLLFHAAEDFAGNGIRGIQAHDFRLLARAQGALAPELPAIAGNSRDPEKSSSSGRGRWGGGPAAPLLFAVSAVERLFPRTFEEGFVSSLSSRVDPALSARAAALPALRYTRPAHGWTRTALSLVDGPLPRARFLLRTLFPRPGDVRANVAPDATGLALAAAWLRVFFSRAGLGRRRGPR